MGDETASFQKPPPPQPLDYPSTIPPLQQRPSSSSSSASFIICVRCLQPIDEAFLLLVGSSLPFHTSCLTCADCQRPLAATTTTEIVEDEKPPRPALIHSDGTSERNGDISQQQACGKCFFRDGNVYCRTHYCQRFVKTLCAKCTAPLQPSDCVMRVEAYVRVAADKNDAVVSSYSEEDDNKNNVVVTPCHNGNGDGGMLHHQFRTELRHFHVECFSCAVCGHLLQRGEPYRYVSASNMLLCKDHVEHVPYESAPYSKAFLSDESSSHSCAKNGQPTATAAAAPKAQGKVGRPRKRKVNNNINNNNNTEAGGESAFAQRLLQPDHQQQIGSGQHIGHHHHALQPGQQQHQQQQQRPKRMRTSFKHHQLKAMKTFFTCNHNPDAKDLKQLAAKTGLTKRVLQVWFQNARAKSRRHHAKLRQHEQQQQQNCNDNGFIDSLHGGGRGSSSRDYSLIDNMVSGGNTNPSIPAVQSLPAPPPPPPPPPPPMSTSSSSSFYQRHSFNPQPQQHDKQHFITHLVDAFSASTTLSLGTTTNELLMGSETHRSEMLGIEAASLH